MIEGSYSSRRIHYLPTPADPAGTAEGPMGILYDFNGAYTVYDETGREVLPALVRQDLDELSAANQDTVYFLRTNIDSTPPDAG